jgi:hypothetical protein
MLKVPGRRTQWLKRSMRDRKEYNCESMLVDTMSSSIGRSWKRIVPMARQPWVVLDREAGTRFPPRAAISRGLTKAQIRRVSGVHAIAIGCGVQGVGKAHFRGISFSFCTTATAPRASIRILRAILATSVGMVNEAESKCSRKLTENRSYSVLYVDFRDRLQLYRR